MFTWVLCLDQSRAEGIKTCLQLSLLTQVKCLHIPIAHKSPILVGLSGISDQWKRSITDHIAPTLPPRHSFANCEDIASIEDVRNPHSKRRQPLHCVSSQYIFGSTEWFLCPNQPNHKHSFVTTENRKEKVAIKNNVRYVNIFNILAVCRNITLYCQHFFWSLG